MLLVLVAGGGLGWFTLQWQREARRQWVIATIQASGSWVHFDGIGICRIDWFGGGVWSGGGFDPPQRPLTADQIDALGSCERLAELAMVSSVMTDEGLAQLSHDKLLQRLYCFKPRITDGGVKHLANLRSLKKLELLGVPELTDATLAHLAGLTGLEEINLSGAKVTGSGLVHLAGLAELKALTIPNSALDDAGLANLGRLTGLRALYLGGGTYTDTGLASLLNLNGLTELGLGSAGYTDVGLARLASLKQLEILNIVGPQVTDAWLDRIAAMQSLRNVTIRGARVSDEAIERLHRSLPELCIEVDGRLR